MNEKGFSLVELSVAVAIAATLAAIAVTVAPSLVDSVINEYDSAVSCNFEIESAASDYINSQEASINTNCGE
jgi:prepilin-type N-terminal cleavage/methylation domain-containing protein